ncbi:hypothetical protein Y981_12690 [Leptospirillum ferriphilum YSK]|uniref:Uncharacterized protein n=1 Tax=Leptospirillum ferriphilum YSK TaxID=1441628 RepID=A0A059XY28_9BACT|nr:hypothetical protein Y981_12690 [Leptospirillum ferriphilum YSK]
MPDEIFWSRRSDRMVLEDFRACLCHSSAGIFNMSGPCEERITEDSSSKVHSSLPNLLGSL